VGSGAPRHFGVRGRWSRVASGSCQSCRTIRSFPPRIATSEGNIAEASSDVRTGISSGKAVDGCGCWL